MLFAVHISDNVLAPPWLLAGFALTAILLWLGSRKLSDDEIPRIAILTAAFFVSSSIHIRVGPTSIHLLLTGLVGVVIGMRAPLAIFTGLLLQAFLIGHGGYYVLGVNACIMTCPALLALALFRFLHQISWLKTSIGRTLIVGIGGYVWFMSAAYGVTLLLNSSFTSLESIAIELANAQLIDPWIVGSGIVFASLAAVLERQLESSPEFPIGFLVGELSVLATVALNCAVLAIAGENLPSLMIMGLVIAHLPFAVVEGVILGFVVGFLARVKPEMLGIAPQPETPAKDAPSFTNALASEASPIDASPHKLMNT